MHSVHFMTSVSIPDRSAANFNASEETVSFFDKEINYFGNKMFAPARKQHSMSLALGHRRSNLCFLLDITQIYKTDSSTKKLQMSLGSLSNNAQWQWHVQFVD